MKKVLTGIAVLIAASCVFAVSYKNNTYQKLADEYTKKAERALDAGEYALAEEYAAKAEENAALSEAYIRSMLARGDCDRVMQEAASRLAYAKSIGAETSFPMAFSAAQDAYTSAQEAYNGEDYAAAAAFAKQVLAALAEIREVTPLPEFYVVRPWEESGDCFWTIAGRPYVYNNPLLWENLYQDAENKRNLPRPSDPNLILPGMKLRIPSLTGEFREGTYSPAKSYEPYRATR